MYQHYHTITTGAHPGQPGACTAEYNHHTLYNHHNPPTNNHYNHNNNYTPYYNYHFVPTWWQHVPSYPRYCSGK
ncbi:hypothetical protein [Metabacillus niabensis]|uniref:hypothetical protein n=1 Tax=Metabacillus niabensis TaxID=324854 RepID=UPI001CF930B6|nr:hypothetical protein [Metabacillus niabensis]